MNYQLVTLTFAVIIFVTNGQINPKFKVPTVPEYSKDINVPAVPEYSKDINVPDVPEYSKDVQVPEVPGVPQHSAEPISVPPVPDVKGNEENEDVETAAASKTNQMVHEDATFHDEPAVAVRTYEELSEKPTGFPVFDFSNFEIPNYQGANKFDHFMYHQAPNKTDESNNTKSEGYNEDPKVQPLQYPFTFHHEYPVPPTHPHQNGDGPHGNYNPSGNVHYPLNYEKPDYQVPNVNYERPDVDYHGPTVNYEKPNVNYQGPTVNYEKPNVDYQGPTVNYEKPNVDYQVPTVNYEKPNVNYQGPTVNYEKPNVNYQVPTVNYEKPNVDYQGPTVNYEKPAVNHHFQTVNYEKPTVNHHFPAFNYENPTFNHQHPTNYNKQPVHYQPYPNVHGGYHPEGDYTPNYKHQVPLAGYEHPATHVNTPTVSKEYNKVVEGKQSYYHLDTCEYRFILDMVQCHEEEKYDVNYKTQTNGHESYQNQGQYYPGYQGYPYETPHTNRYLDFYNLYGNPMSYMGHGHPQHTNKPAYVDNSLFTYTPSVGHPFYAPGFHNSPFAKYYAQFRAGNHQRSQEGEVRSYHKQGHYQSALADYNNLHLRNVVKVEAEASHSEKVSQKVSYSNEQGYEGLTPAFNYNVRLLPNHCRMPGYPGRHTCIVFSGATHPYRMVHRQFVYVKTSHEVKDNAKFRYENQQQVNVNGGIPH